MRFVLNELPCTQASLEFQDKRRWPWEMLLYPSHDSLRLRNLLLSGPGYEPAFGMLPCVSQSFRRRFESESNFLIQILSSDVLVFHPHGYLDVFRQLRIVFLSAQNFRKLNTCRKSCAQKSFSFPKRFREIFEKRTSEVGVTHNLCLMSSFMVTS